MFVDGELELQCKRQTRGDDKCAVWDGDGNGALGDGAELGGGGVEGGRS